MAEKAFLVYNWLLPNDDVCMMGTKRSTNKASHAYAVRAGAKVVCRILLARAGLAGKIRISENTSGAATSTVGAAAVRSAFHEPTTHNI